MFLILFVLQLLLLTICPYFRNILIVIIRLIMSASRLEGLEDDGVIFFGKMTLEEVKKRLFWDPKP